MLRAHRRTNGGLYAGRYASNLYVNRLSSVDLTVRAVRRSLRSLSALGEDGQAGEVAGFLSQFVEYLSEPELRARGEEALDDLVSKANIVEAEDDPLGLRTHERYPLLSMGALKGFLREVLFEGASCDLAQATEIVLFVQKLAPHLVVSAADAQSLESIHEML